MTESLLSSYEAVPYDSRPIPVTDPDAIAAIAALHGVPSAPADACRVLELGCGTGANLISLAFARPKSRFVGVDLSPSHIAAGKLTASEMGLQNVDLMAASIDALPPSLGEFDYIVCHGVYSWVPPEIQQAILRVCSAHLAPHGVVYLSYNTYPGWHRRGMVRDMMLFNDDRSLSPAERVARARSLARFLVSKTKDMNSAHALALREELELIEEQADYHLFHEQLEGENRPVALADLVARVAEHGLQFLAEAKLSAVTLGELPDGMGRGAEDVVRREQYLDFAFGRTFRQTLFCRTGTPAASAPGTEPIVRLHARSRVQSVPPSADDAARGPGVFAFRDGRGATITTNNPIVIAVLDVLTAKAPAVVSFAELHQAVVERLASGGPELHASSQQEHTIAGVLLQCASNGFVDLRALPSRFVATAGNRPKASALARWQALYFDRVASLGHWPVEISGMERFLLPHLDGTNDRAQLVRVIEQAFRSGDLQYPAGIPTREQLTGVLDDVLTRLGRAALLVA